jgi:hypothetical protein
MFQPGDVVKLIPKFEFQQGFTWRVVDRKDHNYGFSNDYNLFLVCNESGLQQVSRNPENFELVEPAYMPYNPNQQEDCDNDI